MIVELHTIECMSAGAVLREPQPDGSQITVRKTSQRVLIQRILSDGTEGGCSVAKTPERAMTFVRQRRSHVGTKFI